MLHRNFQSSAIPATTINHAQQTSPSNIRPTCAPIAATCNKQTASSDFVQQEKCNEG
eukprot:m.1287958 g.1287958  ORF g.1287958 m.1287958 type:complete len:57 (-) comp24781_c0_seq39:755-925(-)